MTMPKSLQEWWDRSPMAREYRAQGEQEVRSERQRLLAEKAAAAATLARALPKLTKERDQATAQRDKALAELHAAQARANAAAHAFTVAQRDQDQVDARCDRRLRETADPRIRAEERRLHAERDHAALMLSPSFKTVGETLYSTEAAIHAHLTGLLAASRDVAELALEDIAPDDLESRFAPIRATVPAPDVMAAVGSIGHVAPIA